HWRRNLSTGFPLWGMAHYSVFDMGEFGTRILFHHGVDTVLGRCAVDRDRGPGGIHWPDLPRGQAAAALYREEETARPGRLPMNRYAALDAFLIGVAGLVLVQFCMTFWVFPMSGEDYALTKVMHGESFGDRLSYIVQKSYGAITGWNARLGEQVAIALLAMPT